MPNKLTFFGTDDFSLPFLELLINQGYEVEAVVTKPDAPQGRQRQLKPPAVKQLANRHGIPSHQPASSSELKSAVRGLSSPAAVLAAYGKILPDEVLDHFPAGIINVHPSDLPRHRGPSPIEQTILDGDIQSAVSLIKLTRQMDAGPIYAKTRLTVPQRATKPSLTAHLIKVGVSLLGDNLPAILNGQLTPVAQSEEEATYCQLISKSDGLINWSQTAEQIDRQIRAYLGWPGSYCTLFGVSLTILSASPSIQAGTPGEHFIDTNGQLGVYCRTGAIILESVRPAGKNQMSAADFVRGYAPSDQR